MERCARNPACVKTNRHPGACRVAGGQADRATGGGPIKASRGAPGKRPAAGGPKAGRSAPPLATIIAHAEKLTRETDGLIADCQNALGAQDQTLAAVHGRNVELLRRLVQSRRQVQRMTAGYRRTVSRPQAAGLGATGLGQAAVATT